MFLSLGYHGGFIDGQTQEIHRPTMVVCWTNNNIQTSMELG